MPPPYAVDVLLPKLADLHRWQGCAVRTSTLAELTGIADRTARKYLVALEARGLVERRGVKGGWLPATTVH